MRPAGAAEAKRVPAKGAPQPEAGEPKASSADVAAPGALAKAAPARRAAGRSPARQAADAFALLCIGGAALTVSLAAAPSLARELGWTHASLSRRPWNTPSTGASPSRNEPILVDPDLFEPAPRKANKGPHAVDDAIEFEDRAPPARFAVAVRDVSVRSAANEGARTVAEVPRGELLLVIREEGEWAMVAHIADDGGTTGWVRSGDLAIR
jgi:uncharacterized protein YgiM (DUF1202 family)